MIDRETKTRRQWVRRLTDPDEQLTLEEFGKVPAALLLREYASPKKLVTDLESASESGESMVALEIVMLMLAHLRENAKDARLGTQHLESMVGTLDEFLALNPLYQQLAEKRARPAPITTGQGPDALGEAS